MTLLATLALGACSDSGLTAVGQAGTGTPQEVFATADAEFAAIDTRLAGLFNTAFVPPLIVGMPDMGTATYTGGTRLTLATAGQPTQVFGAASLTADFAADTISGTVTNFIGTDRTGNAALYSGNLTLAGGVIGAGVPNNFSIGYSGALTGNGEAIALTAGLIEGKFKGDSAGGPLGIRGSDATVSATIDGAPVTGTLALAAER